MGACAAEERAEQCWCGPRVASFGVQEDAIACIVKVMREQHKAHPSTLFIMGSYRIGKERAYLGAARALGWKVHVNADKLRVRALMPQAQGRAGIDGSGLSRSLSLESCSNQSLFTSSVTLHFCYLFALHR